MHVHFRTGKFCQKAVLRSARAQSVNKTFPENSQPCAAICSSAQQGAVRFWRAGHSPKTTATVSVTGMKTSQQLSERKTACPDETWRSLTSPDKTPRPGREFPAGTMPYSRPCASVIQDRAPSSTIEHPATPAAIAVRSAQFSISVPSGALGCTLVRSTPHLSSPSQNVNHRHGMKRLKKGKVPVKFSTRDATRIPTA